MTTAHNAENRTSNAVSASPAYAPPSMTDYWQQLQAVTAQALTNDTFSDCRLQVMDQQIRMLCAGEQLHSAFMPALAHLVGLQRNLERFTRAVER